jgi:hypothetical protein
MLLSPAATSAEACPNRRVLLLDADTAVSVDPGWAASAGSALRVLRKPVARSPAGGGSRRVPVAGVLTGEGVIGPRRPVRLPWFPDSGAPGGIVTAPSPTADATRLTDPRRAPGVRRGLVRRAPSRPPVSSGGRVFGRFPRCEAGSEKMAAPRPSGAVSAIHHILDGGWFVSHTARSASEPGAARAKRTVTATSASSVAPNVMISVVP